MPVLLAALLDGASRKRARCVDQLEYWVSPLSSSAAARFGNRLGILDVGLDAHDVQPLIPIVEAAGGRISDWEGNACYTGGNILACGDPALHDRLLRSLDT